MSVISILFLAPSWKYDGYGIASINRSIINDLWMADQKGAKIKMTCALLQEEDDSITDEDREDARRHNVDLIGVTLPRGKEELPPLSDVDDYCSAFFSRKLQGYAPTYIVGHMPYMFNAAFSIQDMFNFAEVVLVMHALPRKNSTVHVTSLNKALKDAYIVVSVGHPIYRETSKHLGAIQERRPKHKVYLPGGPVELLSIERSRFDVMRGPHNILVLTGENHNMHVPGLDYEVAVAASIEAASAFASSKADPLQSTRVQLLTVGTSEHEKDIWEKQFTEVNEKVQSARKQLSFEYQSFTDVADLKWPFQMSSVCILPFRPDATVYGVEGLWAAYAGTPLLVSSNTGFGDYLHSLKLNEPLIGQHWDLHSGQVLWQREILKKLSDPIAARDEAYNLQQKCLLDTSIACSHLELIRAILGK